MDSDLAKLGAVILAGIVLITAVGALAQVDTATSPAVMPSRSVIGMGQTDAGLIEPYRLDSSRGVTVSAAYLGEVALTPGTADSAARRALKAACTVAGNVSVTYSDGTTGTWPATTGTQIFQLSITQVNTSGTTATCTYSNLK